MTITKNDEYLPGALTRLGAAISALCDAQRRYVDGRLLIGPSLYKQLRAELAGQRGSSKAQAKSAPPIWLDDAQLLIIIDRTARAWSSRGVTTPERIYGLLELSWRPQDTKHIASITSTITGWCQQIVDLLNPQSVKEISAPCPSCAATHVYRKDSSGETVRQPALRLVTEIGCACQACGTTWAPEYYMHLCRLLGCETPEGVLE